MSFILDALKKSESDRQRQTGPALFEVKIAPPKARFPPWAIAIAVLLGVNVVIVGWLLLRHPSRPEDGAAAGGNATGSAGSPGTMTGGAPAYVPGQTPVQGYSQAAAQGSQAGGGAANYGSAGGAPGAGGAAAGSNGAQGAGTGGQGGGVGAQGLGAGAQGAGVGAQGIGAGAQGAGGGAQGFGAGAQGAGVGAQGLGAGAQGAGVGAQRGGPALPPPGNGSGGYPRGNDNVDLDEPTLGGAAGANNPGNSAPANSTPAVAGASPDDYAPATEPESRSLFKGHVQRGTESGYKLYQDAALEPGTHLPALRLDLHVYAAKPQDRFALINMHKIHEGDSLPEGVRVEAITPDGVVMSHSGIKFLLPRD